MAEVGLAEAALVGLAGLEVAGQVHTERESEILRNGERGREKRRSENTAWV